MFIPFIKFNFIQNIKLDNYSKYIYLKIPKNNLILKKLIYISTSYFLNHLLKSY